MNVLSMASSSVSVFRRTFSTSAPSLIKPRSGGNGRLRSRAAASRRKSIRVYEANKYRPIPSSSRSFAKDDAALRQQLNDAKTHANALEERAAAAQEAHDNHTTPEKVRALEQARSEEQAAKRRRDTLERAVNARSTAEELRDSTEERLRSAHRLKPLKMQQRDERTPPNPRMSLAPLADPHLVDAKNINPDVTSFDVARKKKIEKIIQDAPNKEVARRAALLRAVDPDQAYSKQLPLKYEKQFLKLQQAGLFLGPDDIARADFLSALARWRYRVRGVKLQPLQEPRDEDAKSSRKNRVTNSGSLPNGGWYRFFKEIDDEQKPFRKADNTGSYDLAPPPGLEADFDAGLGGEVGEQEGASSVSTSNPLKAISQGRADPLSQPGAEITGQRIYLPNITVKLLRNRTRTFPVKEPYDPWVATFQIPIGMTKTDLRSYLMAVYGLPVSFIRTWIWRDAHARQWRRRTFEFAQQSPRGAGFGRQKGSAHNKKLAIVGLYEPFHYPDDVEELYAQGLAHGFGERLGNERNRWLLENINLLYSPIETRRATQVRMGQENSSKKALEGEFKVPKRPREQSGFVEDIKTDLLKTLREGRKKGASGGVVTLPAASVPLTRPPTDAEASVN